VANQRDIKNRIKSISNTKKITSTMEMVASAKMKKVQQRLLMSQNYEEKLNEIMQNLMSSDLSEIYDPLLSEFIHPTRILILMITGNRGLCGSYNTNVIYNSLTKKEKLADEGKDTYNYVIGKKGMNYFKFINEPMFKSTLNLEDKVNMDYARQLSSELRELFTTGEFHEIYVSYTNVVSSSSQKAKVMKLLPITPEEGCPQDVPGSRRSSYIFDPNPEEMLSNILPLYLDIKVFNCFLESNYSEQFARMVAMKNASDASTDIVKELTITYNRVRQAKITNEIAEIVGGAAALE
jgi:F-type H+-transporting ATPase subunit gamma